MNTDFIEALDAIEKEKGISKDILIEAIETALISGYKKNFNSAQNVRVDINRETGTVRVFARKEVVEEVKDPRLEISLEAARGLDPAYEIGDIVEIEVTPRDFGRIAAQTAKQVVTQRIREAERAIIYNEFIDREEDIVTGVVQRQDSRFIYIDLGRAEALMPVHEKMPTDQFKHRDRVKAYITKVEKTTKGPLILLSRTHPGFLKRLFELEVPEIYDGTVEIKSVAREAGDRSKVAVYSHNKDVDPVGACVGPKGARVQTIVQELNGEKIDIVEWSDDPVVYVANALSPAKVIRVDVYEDQKMTQVIVPDYQLSLAIGKKGQNARLAAKLTNWKIDIKSESEAKEKGLLNNPPEEVESTVETEATAQDHEPVNVPDAGDEPAQVEDVQVDDAVSEITQPEGTVAVDDDHLS
ncbi:NusA antitermination factor [Caldalkalibacillus thermarum TA2.A1]|uniref:Transcription termination/antitermination protein NusA n=1 Tax=Caldalkalibacillus thermarum (strain TA2.A1) TaxID=986075 RepID=F5L9U6_CALTT|nr:transcription termination factor NusA [Caldalkalibacillus thermarum]EGL81945.1 NusA antitermination factor [Caldalkalibacillus thermarum TA2.A1]QZT32985.1 transcription termination factor NusA [Caldalkalibacillus thermarum TA2.A1]